MKKILLFLGLTVLIFSCTVPADQPANQSSDGADGYEADVLGNTTGNSGGDILEDMGDYYLFGGDMILDKDDANHQKIINAILENHDGTPEGADKTRVMMDASTELWPGGIVPYYFTDISDRHAAKVREAMDYIESILNVRFIESSPIPRDYKYEIFWDMSNASTTGYSRDGRLRIFSKKMGVIAHELLHCLGYSHEHQRYDRDSYIRVAPEKQDDHNYVLVPQYFMGILYSKLLSDYDYYSLTHYGPEYITPLDPKMESIIGQRRGLSLTDRAVGISLYGKSSRRVNYKTGDFDGDGRAEILKFEKGTGWKIYLAGSYLCDRVWSYNIPSNQWKITNYIGDFNGDGKDDMMLYEYRIGLQVYLSTGSSFAVNKWHDLEPGMFDDLVGDYNGDGKDDFARYEKSRGWRVYLSTGSSFTDAGLWSSVLCQSSYDLGRYKGDFNGDGKDDLLLYNRTTGWRVLQSTGRSFTDKIWNTQVTGTKYVIGDNVGDFNGDGKDDFIFMCYRKGTKLLLSTGSSFAGSWVKGNGVLTARRVGDFNGDGKDDLLNNYGNRYYVALSTGTNFTNRAWIEDFDIKNILIDDFNGDGKSDMFQYVDQSWWKISKSTGDTFIRYSEDERVPEKIYTSFTSSPGGSVITIGNEFKL